MGAISYGCIGRSESVTSTASARGFDTLRRLPAMTITRFPVSVYS